MKSRPYQYYNTSQILGLLQSNPDNFELAMNVAYEIAQRRRISKEKRVEVITRLEEITANSIAIKNNEIIELRRKLNKNEQRIKELEVTENIISDTFGTLKEQIIQTFLQELTDIKLTLSESSTLQNNNISELKNILSKIDREVSAIKESADIKTDKKSFRILKASDGLLTESSASDEEEDIATDVRITTPPKLNTESDNEGGEIKIGEDDMPRTSDDTTGNERPAIEPPKIESEITGGTINEEEDPPNSEKDKIAPDDPTIDSHCLFDDLMAKKRLSVQNNSLKLKGEFSQEDHRKLVINLAFNVSDKINSKDACLYFFYWWLSNRDEENITPIFILDSLNRDIQSVLDNNRVIEIKPKFRLSSTEFLQLALGGMQEMGAEWPVHPEIKSLGSLPDVVFTGDQVKSKLSSYISLLLKNVPESFEVFMLQLMIRDRFPDDVDYSSPSEHIHHLTKLIADNAQSHEIIDSQVDDSGDTPASTAKVDIDDIEGKTPDPIPADNEESGLKGTLPGTTIPLFEIKHQELITDKRTYRPRNYWVLRIDENGIQIYLELGLRESYSPKSLSIILGITTTEKEYQLYLNEQLICAFRKMINGNYHTEWHHDQKIKWDGESTLPKTYVTHKENKDKVSNFINSYPTLKEPSLWHRKGNSEWQLAKGNNISAKKGAVLHPEKWKVNGVGLTSIYEVHGEKMQWTLFEGKVDIQSTSGVSKTYQSNVTSFNWIILDQSPKWMVKSDMVVVQSTPKIVVYTPDDEVNITHNSHIWIKSRYNSESWTEYSEDMKIPVGIVDIKIEKDGVTTHDEFFNIGSLEIEFQVISPISAEMNLYDNPFDKFSIVNTSTYNITQDSNQINLELAAYGEKIPETLQCRIGNKNQRTLLFHIASPVSGLSIVDAGGHLVPNGQHLTYTTLEGYRIISRKDLPNTVSFKNTLRPDVVISKVLQHESTPLISFKDEIHRLLYLTDIMNYENSVTLELSDETEENTITYTISGFTHSLNTVYVSNNILRVEGPDHELDLFAIPLNCTYLKIETLPIPGNDTEFFIPPCNFTDKFIIISRNKKGIQLMPRFVTLDANYDPGDRQDRIDEYHKRLTDNFFSNAIWRETLAYFNICIKFDIPFSTFDQITALSRSSETAAKAFLFFAIFQEDINTYIQKVIPDLEEDLGISFHWIRKSDWSKVIKDVSSYCEIIYKNSHWEYFVDVLKIYMDFNGLARISSFLFSQNPIEVDPIHHQDIMNLRGRLGERVLGELPSNKPIIEATYGIPFNGHHIVALLLHAPIAAAESIAGIHKKRPIWGGEEIRDKIRRNIQYSQYLDPEFYNRVILHVLQNISRP